MLDSYLDLDTVEFTLGALLDAVISQGMIQSEEKGLEIDYDLPREITTTGLYGDQSRLQQILANFLVNVIQFTPAEKWVRIKVSSTKRHLGGGVYVIRVEFRYEVFLFFVEKVLMCSCILAHCVLFLRFKMQNSK
jgi:phytochrome B